MDFFARKRQHTSDLRRGIHDNKKLQNHVNKYGFDDLSFSIVEPVLFVELLITREQYYIDKLNPFFNILKVAGSNLGYKCSVETKQKLSIAGKGRVFSDEHKRKIGVATKKRMTGTKLSPESIAKRVAKQKGQKRSEEFKRLSSERQKGIKRPQWILDKMHDGCRKIIINKLTGEKYKGVKEASEKTKIKMKTLYNMLNGASPNKTNLAYSPIDNLPIQLRLNP